MEHRRMCGTPGVDRRSYLEGVAGPAATTADAGESHAGTGKGQADDGHHDGQKQKASDPPLLTGGGQVRGCDLRAGAVRAAAGQAYHVNKKNKKKTKKQTYISPGDGNDQPV